jgi:hypothetical protein
MNTWLFVGILQTQVDSFPVTYLKVHVFRYELGSLGYLESSPWKFVHDLEMQFANISTVSWEECLEYISWMLQGLSSVYLDGLQGW